MDVNKCRGWSFHPEFWPLLLSSCTEKADGSSLVYQHTDWNPYPQPQLQLPQEYLMTKLHIPCPNYRFLLPWILQWKIHKSLGKQVRVHPFDLIYLQDNSSLCTSKRGLSYWLRLGHSPCQGKNKDRLKEARPLVSWMPTGISAYAVSLKHNKP